MSEDSELSSEIKAALRDVSAVDPALRDQHIAAALGEISPSASTKRRTFLAAAAAVLVLAGAGVGLSQKSDGNSPAAVVPDTTVTSVPKASSDPSCTEKWAGLSDGDTPRGEFSQAEVAYIALGRPGSVSVYLASEPCTKVGDIDYSAAMDARDNENASPNDIAECRGETEPSARFTDRADGDSYSFVLIKTADGVMLYFEDRCNEPLGSILFP